jgi:cell pole-organizing protein PopZ
MSEKNQPQTASMDEILSSIRAMVEEETDKSGAGIQVHTAPATPQAPAAPAAPAQAAVDDILDLTDVVEEGKPRAAEPDLVDINAFAKSGSLEPAKPAAVDAARRRYAQPDGLAPEPGEDVGEPLTGDIDPSIVAPAAEGTVAEPAPEPMPDAVPEPAVAVKAIKSKVSGRLNLGASASAAGLQVAFPVEVLAEALRPLVKEWVEENLPDIVERLVREELTKLADK